MGLPHGKKSIFGRKTNILLKASTRISRSENTLETRFRSPKGPGTKKQPRKDGVRIWAKKENSFNSFPGRYLHFKTIPKGVLRHAEIRRDIKE